MGFQLLITFDSVKGEQDMDIEKNTDGGDREPVSDHRLEWVKPGVDAQEKLMSFSLACTKEFPWTCPPQRTS